MSPARSHLGGVAANIKAPAHDVWAFLTDAQSWQAWWPDGAPEATDGAWRVGTQLTWPGTAASDGRRATITELDAPTRDASDHYVGVANLKFEYESEGVDFSFRVDGVIPGVSNVILSRGGPPIKEWGIKGPLQKFRLEQELSNIAKALHAAAEKHAASVGPRFHYESREPFLTEQFAAFLKQGEAMNVHYELARYEEKQPLTSKPVEGGTLAKILGGLSAGDTPGLPDQGNVPVEITVVFPPMCSACLEPTTGIKEQEATISSSTNLATGQILHRTLKVPFRVPLCERCAALGLDSLIRIWGFTITAPVRKRDEGHWVGFRLPNVAYYSPFLEANGLQTDRIAPADAHERATQRNRDVAKLDAALKWWQYVRDGLGLHRYAELKYRLSQMGSGDTAALSNLASEYSVTVEQLRDVERIAQEPLEALRVLDSA